MDKRGKQAVLPGEVGRTVRRLLVATCAVNLSIVPVRAQQSDPVPEPQKALVIGATAYTPLPTRFICAAGMNVIRASPDGRDVLIQHTVIKPATTLESLARVTDEYADETLRRGERLSEQLLLLRPDSPDVQIVWQGGGSLRSGLSRFQVVRWLPGTRNALLSVSGVRGPLPPEFLDDEPASKNIEALQASEVTTVLLVNAETGKTRTVAPDLGRFTWLMVSKTHPVAVLVDLEDDSFMRVEANGKVGPRLHLSKPEGKKEAPLLSGFLADGHTLTGRVFGSEADGEQRRTTYYQVDSVTGQMTQVDAAANKPGIRPAEPSPLIVQRETATLTRDGVTMTVHPLWLEARDKASPGRVLIAADSDTDHAPVLLQSGVLYYLKGAVYLVPLGKAAAVSAGQRTSAGSATK